MLYYKGQYGGTMNRWQDCFKQKELWEYIDNDSRASISVMGIISEFQAFTWLREHFGKSFLVKKNGPGKPDFTIINLKTEQSINVEFKRSKTDKFRFIKYNRSNDVQYNSSFCDYVLVDKCDNKSICADYHLVPSSTIGTDPKRPNSLKGNVDINKSVPMTKLF